MEEDDGLESQQLSKFNESQQHLWRIHLNWCKCLEKAENKDWLGLNIILDRVMMELICDIERIDSEKSNKDYAGHLKRINNDIDRAIKYKLKVTLYKKLLEKEVILRKVQQESGKGTEYMDKDFNLNMLD